MSDPGLTRRASLLRLGGLAAAALGAGSWKLAAGAEDAEAVGCVLTPEQTQGPYYLSGEKLRRNITEGRPGTPLWLRTTVVDARTCRPVKGAVVDVWHADAAGIYSGFGDGAASRTFMRGLQRTNAKGLALFRTVYPGWYPGRAVHVHVKVHVGGSVVHTGQLYFPDSVTDAVFRRAPYVGHGDRTTRNADDPIFRDGGARSILRLRKSGSAYVASITMGVRRS
jgi:protocatechuate 3,4-dioxygenase beta subunit